MPLLMSQILHTEGEEQKRSQSCSFIVEQNFLSWKSTPYGIALYYRVHARKNCRVTLNRTLPGNFEPKSGTFSSSYISLKIRKIWFLRQLNFHKLLIFHFVGHVDLRFIIDHSSSTFWSNIYLILNTIVVSFLR